MTRPECSDFQPGDRVVLARVRLGELRGQHGTVGVIVRGRNVVRVILDSGLAYEADPGNLDLLADLGITESADLDEQLRNTVRFLRHEATSERILALMWRAGHAAATVTREIARQQQERLITLQPGGVWIVGAPPAGPAPELTLTSPDPQFGQPSLF